MTDRKEQRAAERFPINAHAACDFVSPVLEDFGPIRIRNISSDGVGLLTNEPLAAGMLLVMNLTNTMKKFTKTLLVRVVHVTPQAGGVYLVGGTFNTPLTYEELCMFTL